MLVRGQATNYREIYQKSTAQGVPKLVSRIATVEGRLVILASCLVLAGWQLNIEILKRARPTSLPMNPLTAVCFIALAMALLLVLKRPVAKWRRWEKLLLSLGVAVFATIVLARYLLHINFMPDRALFSSKLDVPGQIPNAMAPNSALGFILIGVSLMLFDSRAKIARGLSQFLAATVAFLSVIALLGYAYQNRALLEFRAFIPISLYAAICWLLLTTAILCARPEQGFMRLFSSEGGAGFIMRRLLVPAVLLPSILGWLRLTGQRGHLYNTEIGVAIAVAVNILFGCILVWIAGYVLNNKEHEIDRAKDEFLSLAAHQLRTPATSAKMALSLLGERDAGPLTDQQAEFVRIAVDACNQETQIIDNLLNVARMDTGHIILEKDTADLGKMAKRALDEQRTIIDSRHQAVHLDAPSVMAVVDAGYLKTAVDNLISNASKYTPEGGEFSVAVKRSGKKVLIAVADNGVGIDPEDIPKIFIKFTRLDNELSKARSGTGLGMYLTQKIVALHGGKIIVSSKPGHGSNFTIELPLPRR